MTTVPANYVTLIVVLISLLTWHMIRDTRRNIRRISRRDLVAELKRLYLVRAGLFPPARSAVPHESIESFLIRLDRVLAESEEALVHESVDRIIKATAQSKQIKDADAVEKDPLQR